MALKSQLFRGQRLLEACSLNHASHITPGAIGDHVERIQRALGRLEIVRMDPVELQQSRYGQSTARAVLTYKTKRRIINSSYQSTADNIVGVMTINRMDQELVASERNLSRSHICAECKQVSLGTVSALGSNANVRSLAPLAQVSGGNARSLAPKQLGGIVRILVQQTSHSLGRGSVFPIRRHIEIVRDKLFEHGVALSVDILGGMPQTIKFSDHVVFDDDYVDLHKASQAARPNATKVLRVIICSLRNSTHFGETHRNLIVNGVMVDRFVVLNTELSDKDDATLLHEMIHASKDVTPHPHDAENFSVFFRFGNEAGGGATDEGKIDRKILKPEHALTLSKSFFAT
jgi:hypothetical protein